MAAKYFYRQGFLLLLFNFISTAALEKRFSDFKRCADEECSSKFAGLEKNGLQGCIFPHPDTTASHKLRLISRPVANRYLRPELPSPFVTMLFSCELLGKTSKVNINNIHQSWKQLEIAGCLGIPACPVGGMVEAKASS